MNVAKLRVLIDGDGSGALRALVATEAAAKKTAKSLGGTLRLATLAAAGGFGVLATQAVAGGAVTATSALLPLIGLAGLLPGLFVAGAVGAGVLKLGLSGISDAFGALDDPQKFAEAIADLSPAAQAFMRSVRDVKPAFDELQLGVQEALFAGMAGRLRSVASVYLPMLYSPLRAIAHEFQSATQDITDFLLTTSTLRDVSGILDDVRAGYANAFTGFPALLVAFRDVTAVSSSFLPAMGAGLASVATRFRDFIAAARESGDLAGFMQGGIDTARQFGRVLFNVGGIVRSVFAAAPADGVLTSLERLTAGVRDAVRSAEGQEALRSFLTSASQAAGVLGPVIGAALPVLGALAPLLASVATAAGPGLVAGLQGLTTALGLLGPAGQAMGGMLGSVLTTLGGLLPSIAPLLNALAEAAGPVVSQLASVAAAAATAVMPALMELVPALSELAVPVGEVLTALIPLLPAVVQLAAGLATALVPVVGLLAGGVRAVVPVITAFAGVLSAHPQLIVGLAGALGGLIAAYRTYTAVTRLARGVALGYSAASYGVAGATYATTAAEKAGLIVGKARMALTKGMAVAQGALNAVMAMNPIGLVVIAVVALVAAFVIAYKRSEKFRNIVNGAFAAVKTGVQKVVTWLRSAVPAAFEFIKKVFLNTSPVGLVVKHWDTIKGAVGKGATWIRTKLGSLVGWFKGLPGRIASGVGNLGSTLLQAGRDLIGGLMKGILEVGSGPLKALNKVSGGMLDGFMDEWGIHSPSRVMLAMGRHLMNGLAGGIAGGRKVASAAWSALQLETLTMPALATAGAPVAPVLAPAGFYGGTGASAGGGGTVTNMNFHFAAGTTATDADAITAQVQKALGEMARGARVTVRQSRGAF